VSAEYKLGNLKQDAMAAMASSPFQQQFGKQKGQLSARCQSCHWRFACHGGCPKHRFTIHDDEAQNYLCSGYLAFFGHITPYMNVMRRLLLNCQPPALIMSLISEIRQNILQLTESEDERTK
ncbi:TPA: SPASM domain-containing protein, partial [Klebsiella pneumoniae]|nr:SPASM domain-containing protein [Klebsiella pneumoniae]